MIVDYFVKKKFVHNNIIIMDLPSSLATSYYYY